ncbi:MAG TPA: hypothetical protein VMS17_26310 [Gemmataceae bacterium]|nr:hypothetical protein [Gemmataceae bacterium]
MPEENYPRDFPNLGPHFRRTSEPAYYNCISYVVGDLKRRWWPGEYHPRWSDDYWPAGAPHEETLQALIVALATVGFTPCPGAEPEAGFDKIAIYALGNGLITHAARQAGNLWCSKLGPDEDIEHPLEGLEGPCYGNVTAFLKRPVAVAAFPPASPNP